MRVPFDLFISSTIVPYNLYFVFNKSDFFKLEEECLVTLFKEVPECQV